MRFFALIALFLLCGGLACTEKSSRVQNSLPRELPAVVYGSDDRKDLYQVDSPLWKALADSTVAIISADSLLEESDGNYHYEERPYGSFYRLCDSEAFYSQPSIANCSGALVAENLILTAGHCIDDEKDCAEQRFVFNYALNSAGGLPTGSRKNEVYKCRRIVAREYIKDGVDFALVELDRAVPNHRPLKVSRQTGIQVGDEVTVIGSPSGLPTKVIANAHVRALGEGYFTANSDTFTGASGGPVFNSKSGELVGVLVRGEKDFKWSNEKACNEVHHCMDTDCRGEDVTSLKAILSAIPH